MRCDWRKGLEDQCLKKASLFVWAHGGKSWRGYYCRKHAGLVIRRRAHLILRHEQSVVIRKVTALDKKLLRKGKR